MLRRIDASLLHRDLRSTELPIVGCSEGVRTVHSTSGRATFYPTEGLFVQVGWEGEPTVEQEIEAGKIVAEHAGCRPCDPAEFVRQGRSVKDPNHVVAEHASAVAPGPEIDWESLKRTLPSIQNKELPFVRLALEARQGSQWSISSNASNAHQILVAAVQSTFEALRAAGIQAHLDRCKFTTANFGGGNSLLDVSTWLLDRQCYAPAHTDRLLFAIDELIKFVNGRSFPAREVELLNGIAIERDFELYNGVKLMPIDSLKGYRIKRLMDDPLLKSGLYQQLLPNSTAALVRSRNVMRSEQESGEIHYTVHDKREFLCEVARCLTLVGPCPVATTVHFVEFDETTPFDWSRRGWVCTINEILPDREPKEPLNEGDAKDIAREYFGLSDGFRQRLRIPLDRLNLSLRRTENTDKAIELAISLESLLLVTDEQERSRSKQMKIAKRAARYVDGDRQRQKQVHATMRSFYDLRNDVMHTGDVPERIRIGNSCVYSTYVLQDGAAICAEILRKAMHDGALPDWRKLDLRET